MWAEGAVPQYKIEHNSLNFLARIPKVCMDSLNKLQKYKKYISTKVLITWPFFELQTPDFSWEFIWTTKPNDQVQKYKTTKVQNEIEHN